MLSLFPVELHLGDSLNREQPPFITGFFSFVFLFFSFFLFFRIFYLCCRRVVFIRVILFFFTFTIVFFHVCQQVEHKRKRYLSPLLFLHYL